MTAYSGRVNFLSDAGTSHLLTQGIHRQKRIGEDVKGSKVWVTVIGRSLLSTRIVLVFVLLAHIQYALIDLHAVQCIFGVSMYGAPRTKLQVSSNSIVCRTTDEGGVVFGTVTHILLHIVDKE